MKKIFLVFGAFSIFLLSSTVLGQVSVTTNSTSENFDGMGSAGTALPTGWAALRGAGTGTVGAALTPVVDDGAQASGNILNVGTASASDRALGTIASGTTIPYFGASFINNTGATITQVDFSGFMEQWKTGSNAVVEDCIFEYSFDATTLNDGTWTPLSGMDLVEKLTADNTNTKQDGNNVANRTAISASLPGISWLNGATFWIRWRDNNDAGSDGAYAIDDFAMTNNSALPVELVSFTVLARGGITELNWSTATEVSNHGFEVERRAINNQQSTVNNWAKIAFVDGHGTTNTPQNYSYSDNSVSLGKYSYRLKQIDRDGKFEYSKEVETVVGMTPKTMSLGQNYPNPFNPETNIEFAVPASGFTTLKVYNMLGEEVSTLVSGNVEAGVLNKVSFKGLNLASGLYFYTLRSRNFVDTKKMTLMK